MQSPTHSHSTPQPSRAGGSPRSDNASRRSRRLARRVSAGRRASGSTLRLGALSASLALVAGCDDSENITVAGGGAAGETGEAGASGGGSGGQGGGGMAGAGGSLAMGNVDCDSPASPAVPELALELLADGFDRPILLTAAPGDDSRLFVVEKPGRIRVVEGGEVLPEPLLDITDLASEAGNEMGLLGLAFHPNFSNDGRFYVYYSTDPGGGGHDTVVAEYQISTDDDDRADPQSAREVLRFSQPQNNHNGGHLQFGPDGYLYIGSGDGGGANDQHGAQGNGQNLDTLLGKILRIDVDGSEPYGIPEGNLQGGRPEIWSYGLRNPWRFSFDACTGDMYIGDVGQNTLEEIDFEPAGLGGRNYGWRLMEAENCFNPDTGCDAEDQNLVLPVASYGRGQGQSVTGGYVYRGGAIPQLRGTYLYADFSSARFFSLRMEAGALAAGPDTVASLTASANAIASFGQDNDGNLFVVSLNGQVYRIVTAD